MCTRYISPEVGDIERHWHIGAGTRQPWAREVYPGYQAPFIRATPAGPELVVGQWGLIPFFAKERKLKFPTSNARSEELMQKASYKGPWARGQRCIIPAQAFYEPCWETGRHVPWRFQRVDGTPWGLAGLWNRWTDPQTGEILETFTMLTQNADAHPLMNRMHKPDPKRPPELQDKRSVVPIPLTEVLRWLTAPVQEAQSMVRLPPVEDFDSSAEGPPGLF